MVGPGSGFPSAQLAPPLQMGRRFLLTISDAIAFDQAACMVRVKGGARCSEIRIAGLCGPPYNPSNLATLTGKVHERWSCSFLNRNYSLDNEITTARLNNIIAACKIIANVYHLFFSTALFPLGADQQQKNLTKLNHKETGGN